MSNKIELLKWLENRIERSISIVDDIYSSYDGETDKAIISVNIEDKPSDPKTLNLESMVKCLDESKEKGKNFVYVVKDPNGIYYLDVTKSASKILLNPAIAKLSKGCDMLVYNVDMVKL